MPLKTLALMLLALALAGCAYEHERTLRRDLAAEMRGLEVADRARLENGVGAADVGGGAGSLAGGAETGRGVADESAADLPAQPQLVDYLQYAALHSPALKNAYYRWVAAVEKIPQARSLPNPKFSYGYFIREVETRVGPQQSRVALMQMIPWPTKLTSKADMAAREALVQKHQYEAEKLALFYRVRQAYHEYLYLHQSLQVVRDNLTLLQNLEEVMRTRYEAAAVGNPSLVQLQVELGKLENRLLSLEAMRPTLAARLNAAIGRSPALDLPWPETVQDEMPALEENALLAALQAENPALEAARAKIAAAKAGERLARAQHLPDVDVGISMIETDRSEMNVEDNGKDPVMVTLELSLPVWVGRDAAGVREAKANTAAAEAALADKYNLLSADLRMAYFNYGDARRKVGLFADTLVPKAEQALESSRTAFAAGKAGYADLIDAERTLLELRLMAERARVDQAIRLAELEMLAGQGLREDF